MGCGFTNRSELELRLNEFVNFLIITQIKDSQFTEKIRSAFNNNENSKITEKLIYFLNPRTRINNPYETDIINLQNDLRLRSEKEKLMIAFCLLFLTRGNAETIRTNFILLKETFRSEFSNFDSELEHLKSILKFYFSFISFDILKAYKNHSPSISNKEMLEIQEFEKYYTEPVINAYISFFTEKFSKRFSLETFFSEKIDYLHHENVRDELKNFYLDSPLFGKKPQFKLANVVEPIEITNIANTSRKIENIPFDSVVPSAPTQIPTQIKDNQTPYLTSSIKYYTTYSNYTTTPPNSLATSVTNQGETTLASSNLTGNGILNLVSSGLQAPAKGESLTSSKKTTLNKTLSKNMILYINPTNLKEIPFNIIETMRESALRYHNELRSIHSANFLFRNEELEALAQSWAETLASNETIRNSVMVWKGMPVGENIGFTEGERYDANKIVESWYDQRMNYNYSINNLQYACAEFSQLVWTKSHQFGLGVAQSSSGKIYIVANYFPAGNIIGEYLENVRPPTNDKNL